MKTLFVVLGFGLLSASALASTKEFSYNPASGVCSKASGLQGLNQISKEVLFQTGDGECGDFRNMDFMNSMDRANLNLRGANFQGANITFCYFTSSNFEGANFTQSRVGYTQLEGLADKFTIDPSGKPVPDQSINFSN